MKAIDKTKKNLLRCRCKTCPSFKFSCLIKATPGITKAFIIPKDTEKEKHLESLFCAYGASNCIREKKGCKCPGCPVHKEYELDKTYYCLGGI